MNDQAVWRIYARRRPVIDARAAHYLLPPQEGRRIFLQRIVPDLLAGCADRPTAPEYASQDGHPASWGMRNGTLRSIGDGLA